MWACGATSSSSSRTTGFPIDSPLLLSPSLPLSFSLHSFPPVSLCAEYAKPAAAAQKSKVNIASLAYCRRRPLPSPPLFLSDDFNHSCSYHTRVGIRDVQRSCGRCSFACSFLLSGSFLACCSVLVGWALRVGARSSAFGQLRFCSTRPHTKWQSLLSRRRRQSVAGRGQSSSQSNGPASVRERERERGSALIVSELFPIHSSQSSTYISFTCQFNTSTATTTTSITAIVTNTTNTSTNKRKQTQKCLCFVQ